VVEALICRLTLSYPGGCADSTFSSEEDSALLLTSTDPAELELLSVKQLQKVNTPIHMWRKLFFYFVVNKIKF
jgi:hypothetical protein